MSKFLKKDGKLVKQNGKLVKTDDPASCKCCPIDDPCLFGLCIWRPPDPCSTGKCFPTLLQDPDDPDTCNGFPYDCKSEAACNQWYAANPNPLCPCWFCEDGVWVDKPAYAKDCSVQGGYTGSRPPEGVDCVPPPLDCSCIPASVTVKFIKLPECAAGLLDPEYVVPLSDKGGGAYSGAHPTGLVVANAFACSSSDGRWQVNFGTNLFNPDTGPCIFGTVTLLGCGEDWTGDIEQGGRAYMKLNGSRSAAKDNPLP